MFLIFVSGLMGLPEDQMRAATMLGASFWQKFRYLMLPMLTPIIVIALVIRFMEAMKIFDAIFLMTGGGPAKATESFSIYHVQGGLPELPLVLRGRGSHDRARDHDDHRFLRFAPAAFFAGQTAR